MALVRIEELKSEVQSLGVRISRPAGGRECRIREGGAGPAEGATVVLGGSPASVPVSSDFVAASPFHLAKIGEGWALFREGRRVDVQVALPPVPGFYRKSTAHGVPYRKIALMHGIDCLASTVLQACRYWGTESACRFCGVELSWKAGRTERKKNPVVLAEVAAEAKRAGAKHVTLTAGSTGDRCAEWRLFLEAARAITETSGLPVHVQLMPPVAAQRLEMLREAGVTSIGIHLESFDPAVLKEMAPCKASIPMEEYVRAWEEAVCVFGRNQVSSYLLMGLGEDPRTLLEGCERLAGIGVYPYLVPFRPIPGTPLEHREPVRPEVAREIYREGARILERHNIHWRAVRAGCVRCRGCSALPDYQDALSMHRAERKGAGEISLEVTREGPLLEASYAVRHAVFVEEQGVFRETDRDEMDAVSWHILAMKDGECVGTVRITPRPSWRGYAMTQRPSRHDPSPGTPPALPRTPHGEPRRRLPRGAPLL